MIEFPDRAALGPAMWDAIVQGSDDGWVYALDGWQELILAVEEWNLVEQSFAVVENGQPVAVMPLQFNPRTRLLGSSGWGGAGPVISRGKSPAERRRIMNQIVTRCREIGSALGAAGLEISTVAVTATSLAARWGVNPLHVLGLEDRSGVSQVIDLAPEPEALWQGVSKNARRTIRDARERGFEVHAVPWRDQLDAYYELHCETYRRTGVTPHPRAYFQGLADRIAPAGYSVLWAAFGPDGAPVAFHNDARLGPGALYHTGCSRASALESGVNYLLQWEAIMGARAAGFAWYEVGPIFPATEDSKQRGLTTFKTRFGGEPHRQFRSHFSLNEERTDHRSNPHVSSTGREITRTWLRANRQLIAELAGETTAARLARVAVRGINAASAVRAGTRRRIVRVRRGFPKPVPFMRPYWDDAELRAGQDALPTLRTGHRRRLEERLRQVLAVPESDAFLLTGSGRSALEVGLRVVARRCPERNKVLVPSFGCRGIYDPIVQAGLEPVFVEVDDDLVPDAEDTIARMDNKVLACLIVHTSGKQMAAARVVAAARRHGIFVIEDDCHALGKAPSDFTSDLKILSFGIGKSAMASAGGALIASVLQDEFTKALATLEEEPSEAARGRFAYFFQRYFGSSASSSDVAIDQGLLTQYGPVRMSVRDALIMTCQLDKLEDILAHRRRNAEPLRKILATRHDLFHIQSDGPHTFTKLTVTCRDRDLAASFRSHMADYGIELEEMYFPLHEREFAATYKHRPLPRTAGLKYRVLNLPVRPNLSERQVHRIGRAIADFARKSV